MTKYVHAEFVLTRGPEGLRRRVPLRVPVDGTPLSVGRALDNDVVLDSSLLFASNHHCRLFRRARTPETREKPEDETIDEVADGEQKAASKYIFGQQQQELCLVDVGSSNGTFINGIRVKSGSPTPLSHGDAIVLGGMRDIEVGASMPLDGAMPEIVTWRISFFHDGCFEEFEFEETPPVFPRVDFVEEEQKRLTLALLCSVRRSPQRATSDRPGSCASPSVALPPPAVVGQCDEALQREKQHDERSSQALAAQNVPQLHEDNGAASVPLKVDVPTEVDRPAPAKVVSGDRNKGSSPPTVYFTTPLRAVRIGSRSFILPQTHDTPTKLKKARAEGSRNTSQNNTKDTMSHPHTLSISHTDWKWTIMKVNAGAARAKRRPVLDCVIPWSAVARIMYCAPHHGLTVELHQGIELPLAEDHKATNDMNFITWLVGTVKDAASAPDVDAGASFEKLLYHIRQLGLMCKWPAPHPVEEAEFLARYAPNA